MSLSIFSSIALIIIAPFLGGLLCGIDRKLTARMQNRIGPPILQPFYDVLKLWGKQPMISSSLQPILASSYFLFSVVALALLALDDVYRSRGYRYGDPVILDEPMLDEVARVFFLDPICCRKLLDLAARLTKVIKLSDTFAGTSVTLMAPYTIERI